MENEKLAEFLSALTPEAKLALASLLTGEDTTPKKTTKKKAAKKIVKKKETVEELQQSPLGDAPIKKGKKSKPKPKKPYSSLSNIPVTKTRASRSNVPLGPRPNIFRDNQSFLGEGTYEKLKEDTELDKKLWEKRRPSERNRHSMVESTCKVCGKEEEVSVKLLTYDADDNSMKHFCDECSKGRK